MLYAIILLLGLAGGGWAVHEIEFGKYESLVARQEAASASAIAASAARQKAIDAASASAETQAVAAQAKERVIYRTVQKEILVHVPVTPNNCITWGLVRVLDAAVLGRDPNDLHIPAGGADATCANVSANALAESVVDNYGRARLTALQLTELQAYVAGLAKAPLK